MIKNISNLGDTAVYCDFGNEVNKTINSRVTKLRIKPEITIGSGVLFSPWIAWFLPIEEKSTIHKTHASKAQNQPTELSDGLSYCLQIIPSPRY